MLVLRVSECHAFDGCAGAKWVHQITQTMQYKMIIYRLRPLNLSTPADQMGWHFHLSENVAHHNTQFAMRAIQDFGARAC